MDSASYAALATTVRGHRSAARPLGAATIATAIGAAVLAVASMSAL